MAFKKEVSDRSTHRGKYKSLKEFIYDLYGTTSFRAKSPEKRLEEGGVALIYDLLQAIYHEI